jgi:hypothetical protein
MRAHGFCVYDGKGRHDEAGEEIAVGDALERLLGHGGLQFMEQATPMPRLRGGGDIPPSALQKQVTILLPERRSPHGPRALWRERPRSRASFCALIDLPQSGSVGLACVSSFHVEGHARHMRIRLNSEDQGLRIGDRLSRDRIGRQ